MTKQIISKFQIIMLITALSCGCIMPVFAYEHFVGIEYPLILCCACLLSFFMLIIARPFLKQQDAAVLFEERWIKKIFLVLTLLHILIIFMFVFYSTIKFWISYDYLHSPFFIFAILISIMIYLCASFRLEPLARIAMWTFLTIFFILSINFINLLPQMKLDRFLPLSLNFNAGVWRIILILFAFQLAALLIFILFRKNFKDKLSLFQMFLPFLIGLMVILLAVVRTILVLGRTSELYVYPLIQSLKLIEFPGAVTGMELFGVLAVMTVGLCYLITLFYALEYGSQKLIKTTRPRLIGIILIVFNYCIYLLIAKCDFAYVLNVFSAIIISSTFLISLFLLCFSTNYIFQKSRKRL